MSTVRRPGFRLVSVVVVVFILAITAVGALATRHAVQSEERHLLNERASEIGLVLSDAFSALQTQLATTATETKLNGADDQAFSTAANAIFTPQPGTSTALAHVSTGSVSLVTASGSLPATAVGPRAAVIRRALTVQPVGVTTAVFTQGTTHVLGLAYAVGTGGLVVYREIPLNPTAAGTRRASDQPFHELSVALYSGMTQNPDDLVLTTGGRVPLTGSIATAATPFGADKWLVAVKATSPLVGGVSANAFWLVLGGGIIVALAVGALVESLRRRRDYALNLVDERTEELSASMTKLEAVQEQLLRQARLAAIGELASAVGHELRNPLGVITNAHYLLRNQLGQPGNENLLRHLTTAEREVGAASLIVGDLLDFARAREPVTGPVDVPALVDEVFDVIPPPTGVAVSCEVGSEPPLASADRDQLRQVLLNLITNSYEAMPDGGAVTVTVAGTGGRVQITVTDSGTGMDGETVARVFEPFYTRKARGIGLGLAVTKRIIDSHGGSITVTSSPGSGSTFTVDLPVAVREPAQ